MCWSNKNIKIKIAKRDIKTKKVVKKIINENFYISVYHNYFYKRNIKTPNININPIKHPEIKYFYEIFEGYHSYSNKIKIIKKRTISNNYISIYSKNKFLDYFSSYYENICIVDCIIPKGTKYYLNNNGEYVSETIIIL